MKTKDYDTRQERFDHGSGMKTTAKPEFWPNGMEFEHPLPGHNQPLFKPPPEPSQHVTNVSKK